MRLTYRPTYYLTHPLDLVREFVDPCVAFWQRGRRGWARCDVWNMDVYHARVTAEMLRELAATDFGSPPNFMQVQEGALVMKGISTEGGVHQDAEWVAYLDDLASAFEEYLAVQEGAERYNLAAYEATLARMRHLFDYYPSLWS